MTNRDSGSSGLITLVIIISLIVQCDRIEKLERREAERNAIMPTHSAETIDKPEIRQ